MVPPTPDTESGSRDPFWEQIAAYAWHQWSAYGRGAVVLHEGDIGADRADGSNVGITYLPLTDDAPLWNEDTRALAREYNPDLEVCLITMESDGEAMCMILETQPGAPTPPEAAEQ